MAASRQKIRLVRGHAGYEVARLEKESVDCIVTSPPYWRQRDEKRKGQIGWERNFWEYLDNLEMVFVQCWKCLREEGGLWLNIGEKFVEKRPMLMPYLAMRSAERSGFKLVQDIVWAKPNPMPSPNKRRFTAAHEHVFFMVKNIDTYYFKQVREPAAYAGQSRGGARNRHSQDSPSLAKKYDTRNKRDVWWIKPATAKGNHHAVFPEELVEVCIEAGCPEGGMVLDPFMGSGTTGVVAKRMRRDFVGIELVPKYLKYAEHRIQKTLEGDL